MRSDIPANVGHENRSEHDSDNLATVLTRWAGEGRKLVFIDQHGDGNEPYYIFEVEDGPRSTKVGRL